MIDAYCRRVFRKFPVVDGGNSKRFLRFAIEELPEFKPSVTGTGIVLCGGGLQYLPSLFINVSMLRHFGVRLPIQIWHLGPSEIVGNIKWAFNPLGVRWIDAHKVARRYRTRTRLQGWSLKAFAMLHCGFKDVLYLDADCSIAQHPNFLFGTSQYRETGALFWADPCVWLEQRSWQELTGLASLRWLFPERNYHKSGYWEIEAGQMVIDMSRLHRLLLLQRMINEYSDFYFQHFYGDKHTLQIALGLLRPPFVIVDRHHIVPNEGFIYLWLDGKPLFQHRVVTKFSYNCRPIRTRFAFGGLHARFLRDLHERWEPDFNFMKRRRLPRQCALEA